MPTQTFSIVTPQTSSALSPDELKTRFLFGINLVDENGNPYPETSYQKALSAATTKIENELDIKTQEQIIHESRPFRETDYLEAGYVRTSFPVGKALELKGYISTEQLIDYPEGWLSEHIPAPGNIPQRRMNIVPAGAGESVLVTSAAYGFYPGFAGRMAPNFYNAPSGLPDYWRVTYYTPGIQYDDIIDAIGKLASIEFLNIAGDVLGLGVGIASKSISVDGLSQSISSTNSATSAAFNARILNYSKEIPSDIDRLKRKYKGLSIMAFGN